MGTRTGNVLRESAQTRWTLSTPGWWQYRAKPA